MRQSGNILVFLGTLLMVGGVAYLPWYLAGPLRSGVEDQRASDFARSVFLIGGALLILGFVFRWVEAGRTAARELSRSERLAASRRYTMQLATAPAVFATLHGIDWLIMLLTVAPGQGIRPMHLGYIVVGSFAVLLAGIATAGKQLIVFRSLWFALATLGLATIPLCVFAVNQWHLRTVLGIWYKK
jgi:hypothetical protein